MPSSTMNDMMRSRRKDMNEYMYQSPDSSSSDPSTSNDPAADTAPDNTVGSTPDAASSITVLAPGDPSDDTMFTYEKQDNGAWMVYPPGVPCETGKARVQLDHAATESEYADMETALEDSNTMKSDPGPDTAEGPAEGGAY